MTTPAAALGAALGKAYRIERELGQGGMATVYLAHDLRHDRKVAIKVVRSEISAATGTERFLREIRLAARLHHPNILPLYDSGEADGQLYYVMPVAEGESLRNRLERDQSLSVGDAVRLASEVAGALDYAHRHEIVHRDIKPENILLHEGHALITDFGIGKALSTATTGATLTQLGLVVGTPAYMSPEQAGGEPNLDGRSDLYSLGCVLYEMLVGEPAFTGPTVQAVIARRFKETPPDATGARPSVPRPVAEVARKLMAREPQDRYATGAHAVEALTRSVTPVSGTAAYERTAERAGSRLPWVAVLPFATRDAALADLAEGLAEDITTGLSRFSHLQVVARQSTANLPPGTDVRRVGESLGARYVVEGSLRKSGNTVRLSAQLVDAQTGTHLWAETFDRDLGTTNLFALQDELADRIVATVADPFGILVRVMAHPLMERPVEELSATELVLRLYAHNQRLAPEEHARLRTAFEQVLEREPNHADAWAALATIYWGERMHGLNPLPDPMTRALAAAERAVRIDSANQAAWESLAEVQYFTGDVVAFRQSAERTIALNRRNASALAIMAMLICYSGEWERGYELIQRAMALNPHHAGWFHFVPCHYHFKMGDYEAALAAAKRINMPDFPWTYSATAVMFAALARWDEAHAAVLELRRKFPAIEAALNSGEASAGWFHDVEHNARWRVLWQQAAAGGASAAAPVPAVLAPTIERASSRLPWVAVLPFTTRDPELADLAEGIAEEVTAGFSKFSMLQVVAWQSAKRVAGTELREAGKALGARYLVEGSIRKSGRQVRVNAQLVDVLTGTSPWAESYDRELDKQSLFELQDDLVDRIVVTVADPFGVLVRTMAAPLKDQPVEGLTASELVIRLWAYSHQVDPEEHARLRAGFERALEREPDHADAWGCLADLYWEEQLHGMNVLPDPLGRARRAAQRAVEIDPTSQFGWCELALVNYFAGDLAAFRPAAERALALNPRNGANAAILAVAFAFGGEWERGYTMIRRLMDLNPNHAGWYHFVPFHYHFRRGEYQEALASAKRVNMPHLPWTYTTRAMAAAELGLWQEVETALDELRRRFPGLDITQAGLSSNGWIQDREAEARETESWKKAMTGPAKATESGAIQSIAVLPFACMSAGEDDAWFSDGITEEIINVLAQLEGLKVAARTSSFAFKGKDEDLRVIGEKLGVQHVLEGSVRKAGSRIRITAQLIKTADGYHVWSERYDRELVDIFAVQDELANAIAAKLKLSLLPTAPRTAPRNLEAYQLMLKGRALLWQRGRAILDAIPVLEQAVALDPGFGEAQALLGDALRTKWIYGMAPAAETIPRALAALERALALEPEQPQALATLANIRAIHDHDWEESLRLAERVLSSNPLDIQAVCERGVWLALRHDTPAEVNDRSLAQIRAARRADPLNSWAAALECMVLGALRRFAEAEPVAREAIALDPSAFTGRWGLVWILSALRRDEEAIATAREALAMSGRNPRVLAELAALHARRGESAAVRAILEELEERAASGFIEASLLGCVAAAAGSLEQARALVARGIAAREAYPAFARWTGWGYFEADPEGAAMLRAIGF